MRDLWIEGSDLIVGTHGRSFWILDDIAALRELTGAFDASATRLFTPASTYRVQRDTYTDTPMPPDEPAAANPPDGAIFDYYLAQAASGPVTLEILDARGQLVHKFSSADQPKISEADLKKQLIPLYWPRPFRSLRADAGMHRWVWGLHYPAPDSTRHEFPISAIPGDTPRYPLGPTVLPGSYTARLTVDGKSYTQPFSVKMDPRVKTSAAGLERKFRSEMRLASLLTQTSQAVLQAGSLREPLQKLSERTSGAVHESVQSFQSKLSSVLAAAAGAAPGAETANLTQLNGQVGILYAQVWQSDTAPTAAQDEALAATQHDAADVMKRWDALKAADLPALDLVLRNAGLPEVQIQADPHREEAVMDEE
jgi:hypothetical protein